MSAPCWARRLAEGHTYAHPDEPPPSGPDLGHEPLLRSDGHPVYTLAGLAAYFGGVQYEGCWCRHCHALVLIPRSELKP